MLTSPSSFLRKMTRPRLLVWTLFLAALLGAATLGGSTAGFGAYLDSRPAAVSGVPSAPSLGTSATLASGPGTTLLSAPGPNVTHSSVASKDPVQALEDLPAWRWDDFGLDTADEASLRDIGGTAATVANGAAGLLFGAANLLWLLLLGIMKIALSANLIASLGGAITEGMVKVAGGVMLVVGLIWGVVLFKLVRDVVFKKSSQKAVVSFVLFTIAAGGIAWTADQPVSRDGKLAVGSIPWAADNISGRLGEVASDIGSGFGIGGTGSYDAPSADDTLQGGGFNCSSYVYVLQQRYVNAAENGTNASHKAGAATLVMADKMWETTFFNSWTTAQFGMPRDSKDYNLGQRVACHAAEFNSGIPATGDQSKVSGQNAAQDHLGQGPVANAAYNLSRTSADNLPGSIFGPFNNKSDERKAVTAWMGCFDKDTVMSSKTTKKPFTEGLEDWSADTCKGVFSLDGKVTDKGELELYGDDYEKFDDRTTPANLQAADWAGAYSGQNATDRLTQGMLALIVALLFLIALGGIAGGLLVAQFMLVVLLLLLPVTFAFLAMGMGQGPRMLKLTGTTMAAKAMFTLLLAFLGMLITLGQSIVESLGADGSGGIEQVLYGLMPILALLVLRKIASNLGMGDIIKPTGALSFMAASSMMATRDSSLMKTTSERSKKGSSLLAPAGGRLNRLEKKLGKKGLDLGGAAAGTVLTKGGGIIKDKAEKGGLLGDTKRQEAYLKDAKKAQDKKDEKELEKDRKETVRRKYIQEHLDKGKRVPMQDLLKDMEGDKKKLFLQAHLHTVAGKVQNAAAFGAKASTALGLAGAIPTGGGAVGVAAGGVLAAHLAHKGAGKVRDMTGNALDEALLRKAAGVRPHETFESVVDAKEDWAGEKNALQTTQKRLVNDASGEATKNILSARSELQIGQAEPFVDVASLNGAKADFAKKMGIPEDFVIGAMSGLVMVNPALDIKNVDVRKHFSADKLAACGEVFLDVNVATRLRGESEDDYTMRMMGEKISQGLITSQGRTVDVVLSKAGLDISSVDGLAEVSRWLEGGQCEALGSLVLNSSGQSSKHIQNAVKKWGAERQADYSQIMDNRVSEIAQAMQNAKVASTQSAVKVKDAKVDIEGALRGLEDLMAQQSRAQSQGLDAQEFDAGIRQQREQLVKLADTLTHTFVEKFQADTDIQVASMASQGVDEATVDKFVAEAEAMATRSTQEIARAARSSSRGGAHLGSLFDTYSNALEAMQEFETETLDREAAAAAESRRLLESEKARAERVGRQVKANRKDLRGGQRSFPAAQDELVSSGK